MGYHLERIGGPAIITCDKCGHWIKGDYEDLTNNSGWYGGLFHARNHKFGSNLWFCPTCQKKVTLHDMQSILAERKGKSLEEFARTLAKHRSSCTKRIKKV